MRSIRSTSMRPELIVRSLVHRLGFRFRLHRYDLPGRPDLVFISRRKIIQVHGCFWHQHTGCARSHIPNSKLDYWLPKLERNKRRDNEHLAQLKDLGWSVLVVWECELKRVEPSRQGSENNLVVARGYSTTGESSCGRRNEPEYLHRTDLENAPDRLKNPPIDILWTNLRPRPSKTCSMRLKLPDLPVNGLGTIFRSSDG